MGPLAATLQALNDRESRILLSNGDWPPGGQDWFPVSRIIEDPKLVGSWIDALLAGEANGRRDVAGSYLSGWFGGMLASTAACSLILQGRTWPLYAAGVALHRHPDGWFDRLALRSPAVLVLAGDPADGHPDARVFDDVDQLRSRLAEEIMRLVEPLFVSIRAATRYPLRSMWGSLADGIVGQALWTVRSSGDSGRVAWSEATDLLDQLAGRVPLLKTRPTPVPVDWSNGSAYLWVKGTCCLYFKAYEGKPDPCGEGYCNSCPFRQDASRLRRWAAWLEEEAAGTG
jgi:hypothetical protein